VSEILPQFIFNFVVRYVIDEYCTARKAVVLRSFLDALTVGGAHGTPRPMELHAHDPPRYVGDMLAWLHQMTPTEKESAHSLLKGCDKSGIIRNFYSDEHEMLRTWKA